jgi:Membrane domain of glycerophosphoryl diester phosphodiesterase
VTAAGALREAIGLLARNVVLLGAIVLTISVPVTLVAAVVERGVFGPDAAAQSFAVSMGLDALLGPIASAALVHALAVLRRDGRPSYGGAMRVGLANAGRVFKANVFAGLLMVGGFLAGIVPGVVLAVRWALIDPIVVLEGADARTARRRSATLTRGRRWTIAIAAVLSFACIGLVAAVANAPLYAVPALDVLPVHIGVDSALDVVYTLVDIVMFVLYWESRDRELATARPAAA